MLLLNRYQASLQISHAGHFGSPIVRRVQQLKVPWRGREGIKREGFSAKRLSFIFT